MPKQKYKCENSGALCPFALEGKEIELEAGDRPKCGVEGCTVDKLVPIGSSTRLWYRNPVLAIGALVLVLLLITACSLLGVGMMGKQLSASQTMLWALQKIHLADRLDGQTSGRQFFSGYIVSDGSSGPSRTSSDFLYSEIEGQAHCLWRHPSQGGDLIHFELTSKVPYAYVLHRGGSQSVFVTPRADEISKVSDKEQVRAPLKENIRLGGGPGTEQFVLIFGTSQISDLENQLKAGSVSTDSLDQLTARLAKDPEFTVLHVEVPHT
jgi:hypothetical protein